MLGDDKSIDKSEINKLLPEFSAIVQDIFENTAPLMTVPPTLARKYKLKIWSEFETSVTRTLEIANAIVDAGLKMNSNGLLKEMQSNNMSTEMIKRIFIDLIIAAGDTVIEHKNDWAPLFCFSIKILLKIVRNSIMTSETSMRPKSRLLLLSQ